MIWHSFSTNVLSLNVIEVHYLYQKMKRTDIESTCRCILELYGRLIWKRNKCHDLNNQTCSRVVEREKRSSTFYMAIGIVLLKGF